MLCEENFKFLNKVNELLLCARSNWVAYAGVFYWTTTRKQNLSNSDTSKWAVASSYLVQVDISAVIFFKISLYLQVFYNVDSNAMLQ